MEKLVIECIEKINEENGDNTKITADMTFGEIPSFDSMVIVNFQAELAQSIGDIAFEIAPMMEMKISEYILLLESSQNG